MYHIHRLQDAICPWANITTIYMTLANIKTNLHAQTYRHTDIQTYRHSDIQTYRHTDIQTYRHTDIQTYRHTDRQTDRQTDKVGKSKNEK